MQRKPPNRRTCRSIVRAAAAAAAFALAAGAAAQRSELPLVQVEPAPGPAKPLVLLLSGDGDWAPFMRSLSQQVAAQSSPVLGLKSRSYLSKPRTPEAMASALERAVGDALEHWQRDALIIVGYSRGADLAPFVVNRWKEDLRARVRGIVFVGLSEHAGFEFHLEDLMFDIVRSTDLPTRPEVERLTGIPLVCIYGADEKDSFCPHPLPGMRVLTHPGGHRVNGDENITGLVLQELDRLE